MQDEFPSAFHRRTQPGNVASLTEKIRIASPYTKFVISLWRLAWVAVFLLAATCRPAWAAEPSSCTAEMLDVRVLPLIESHTGMQVKTLVIEIQNRSPSP